MCKQNPIDSNKVYVGEFSEIPKRDKLFEEQQSFLCNALIALNKQHKNMKFRVEANYPNRTIELEVINDGDRFHHEIMMVVDHYQVVEALHLIYDHLGYE